MQAVKKRTIQSKAEVKHGLIMQGRERVNCQQTITAQLLDTLAQCQGVAIDLGNFIEQMKGEQHPSAKVCVAALEKYCEKIFNAYNKLPLINEQPEENPQIDNGTQAGTAQAVWTDKIQSESDLYGCEALQQAFVQMKQTVENEIIHKSWLHFAGQPKTLERNAGAI